ncbi:hypothetical protein ACIOHB_36330 [Streptomyces microflavus]|uniref:hypothetical protein n=1 Tax=Streptomyces microflavus TaxID=1919 RepID=UPI0037FDE5DB
MTEHARFLVEDKKAHCIAVVNHPTLQATLKKLPRRGSVHVAGREQSQGAVAGS